MLLAKHERIFDAGGIRLDGIENLNRAGIVGGKGS